MMGFLLPPTPHPRDSVVVKTNMIISEQKCNHQKATAPPRIRGQYDYNSLE